MATAVIIPARNEAKTLPAILEAFNAHAETSGHVYVGVDADTTDKTDEVAWNHGACGFVTDQRGKGQVVRAVVNALINSRTLTPRLLLCDGDYAGLTLDHIDAMVQRQIGMTIGVPDWPAMAMPERLIQSWPWVSGIRCLPWQYIPEDAHGYLLETQINLLAAMSRSEIAWRWLDGLKSPFQWPLTEQREKERRRDQRWGMDHGINI